MSFLNLFRGTGNKLSKLASNKPTITKVDDAFARWATHHRDHQKKAIEAHIGLPYQAASTRKDLE
jgi:hypothetical protein